MFRKSSMAWAGAAASGVNPSNTMTHSVPVILERPAVLGTRQSPPVVSSGSGASALPVQRVVILPILHAGTTAFYDQILLKLHKMVRGNPVLPDGTVGQQHNEEGAAGGKGAAARGGDAPIASNVPSTLLGRQCQQFLHSIVVEGVNGSESDVTMQRSEWLRAATVPEDAEKLVQAATTYAAYYQDMNPEAAANTATPFDQITANYCKEYSLRFPLPPGIILEDFYFKHLLAVSMGHCCVNSDVILSNIPSTLRQLVAQAGLGSPALSAYRNSRFVDSVLDNLSMATAEEQQRERVAANASSDAAMTAAVADDTGMKAGLSTAWDSATFPEGRQVTALWGHAHVPRVVELLKGMHGFKEATVAHKGVSPGRDDVTDFVTSTIPYGWDPATHMEK